MRRVTRGILALLALVAVTEAFLLAQGAGSQFRLAVMRRDGILIPFASFNGRKWSSPWPVPAYNFEAPLTLDAVPREWWGSLTRREMTWTLYPASGEPRVLFMKAPVVFAAHCLSNVGLATDYRSPDPVPPPAQHHHPKDGLAVMGKQAVRSVEVLQDSSPEWIGVTKLIFPTVVKAQVRAVGGAELWALMSQVSACAPQLPTLEVLCRFSLPGGRAVYYYEALGQFGRPATASGQRLCNMVTFTQGFAIVEGKDLVYVSAHGTYTNGDMRDVDYGVPLGVLEVGQRVFWVTQWSGRGREAYAINEVLPKDVQQVLMVPGGGC